MRSRTSILGPRRDSCVLIASPAPGNAASPMAARRRPGVAATVCPILACRSGRGFDVGQQMGRAVAGAPPDEPRGEGRPMGRHGHGRGAACARGRRRRRRTPARTRRRGAFALECPDDEPQRPRSGRRHRRRGVHARGRRGRARRRPGPRAGGHQREEPRAARDRDGDPARRGATARRQPRSTSPPRRPRASTPRSSTG